MAEIISVANQKGGAGNSKKIYEICKKLHLTDEMNWSKARWM